MNRPYIVCHMMASLDGRIDCAMMEKLEGTREYEETLQALNAPTTLSGRVTAQLEMAGPGEFVPADPAPYAREGFSKKTEARGYQVVVDTQGRLLWDDAGGEEAPLVIVTSQQVPKEYLADLDAKHISWIACGEAKIDLARAVALLAAEFGVERLAVVGGGSINAGFLAQKAAGAVRQKMRETGAFGTDQNKSNANKRARRHNLAVVMYDRIAELAETKVASIGDQASVPAETAGKLNADTKDTFQRMDERIKAMGVAGPFLRSKDALEMVKAMRKGFYRDT